MSIFKPFGKVTAHGISDTFTITPTGGTGIVVACDAATVAALRRKREVLDGIGCTIGVYYYNLTKQLVLPFYFRGDDIGTAVTNSDGVTLGPGDEITFTSLQTAYPFSDITTGKWLVDTVDRTQARDDWQGFSLSAMQYEAIS